MEDTVPDSTLRELSRRGHDLEVLTDAGAVTGSLKGIVVDQDAGRRASALKGARPTPAATPTAGMGRGRGAGWPRGFVREVEVPENELALSCNNC